MSSVSRWTEVLVLNHKKAERAEEIVGRWFLAIIKRSGDCAAVPMNSEYIFGVHMTIRKSPHTNTQQDTKPEQSDLEANEQEFEADSEADQTIYQEVEGAETGMNR